jgi:putative ABC transport system substrate-binding protein
MPSGTNITFLPPGGAVGDPVKISAAANYFAQNAFDVVVTAGTEAALACKTAMQANQRQFVFASVGDPAISGLIPASGGNFTGGSNLQVSLVQARVTEMLKPVHNFQAPFAVVGNYTTEPTRSAMTLAFNLLSAIGPTQIASITPQNDVRTFIRDLKNQGIKSLYVCSDLFITSHGTELNAEAHAGLPGSRMKTMFEFSEYVRDQGGDLSYGVSFTDLFENAAAKVVKILSGSKAGDLPIYYPSPPRLELAVKTSRAYPTKKRAASGTKKKSRRRR